MADQLVVLARGRLAGEDAALAVRLALALPLGGLQVGLVLVDEASALALEAPLDLSPWGGGLGRELEALVSEDEVRVEVELESLQVLGLDRSRLRAGVSAISRDQVARLCGQARHCLVI